VDDSEIQRPPVISCDLRLRSKSKINCWTIIEAGCLPYPGWKPYHPLVLTIEIRFDSEFGLQ